MIVCPDVFKSGIVVLRSESASVRPSVVQTYHAKPVECEIKRQPC
jgi:hypothetical protein